MTDPVASVVRHVNLAARVAVTVGLLSGGALAVQAAPASAVVDTYTTNFAATENPISEGGTWLSGRAMGLDWSDVRTTPGRAFGTQDGTAVGTFAYADSTAVLNGTFGPDQEASGTVFNNDTGGDWNAEVELRLRSTMTPHFSTGYEIEFRARPDASAYCDIVRWNGALGSFTPLLHLSGSQCAVRTGDVLRATMIGSTITAYRNGIQVMQVSDGTYTSGNPGIGFFLRNLSQVGNSANFGFSSFGASTLAGGTPTSTPVATSTPVPTSTPVATSTSVPPTAVPAGGGSAYATIQAEQYTTKAARPRPETTSDTGGGLDMGYIRSTDWLAYNTINFGATPATQFMARVASGALSGTTGVVEVHLDSVSAPAVGSFVISNTGGVQSWVTQTASISPTTGTHTVYLVFTSASSGHFVNVNWFTFGQSASASPTATPTQTASPTSTPTQTATATPPPASTSTPVPPTAVPAGGVSAYATIQAESYTAKAARPQPENTTDTGGGLNIGYIRSTDWLAYNTVDFGSTPATQFIARVASGALSGTTGTVEVHLDSVSAPTVGSFVISNTGGIQSWVTRTASITPTTGTHAVYLVFTSASSGHFVNVNWFDFAH